MRYDSAMAYPRGNSTTEFFWVYGDEIPYSYQHLCTGIQGYAFNRAGRKPQPRYFDADVNSKRGNCAAQVLVNDSIPAPARPWQNPNTK